MSGPVSVSQGLADHHFARNIGQAEVREDDVEVLAGRQLSGFTAASGGHDVRSLSFQEHLEDIADIRRILDQEIGRAHV